MANEKKVQEARAALDKEWSERVAGIAVVTCVVAKPPLLAELTPEQIERCTRIVAEEIYIRLIIGDRPPDRRRYTMRKGIRREER